MKVFTKGRILLACAFVGLASLAAVTISRSISHSDAAPHGSTFSAAAQAATPEGSPPEEFSNAEAETAPVVSDDPFVIKRVLPISGPIKYGEWHWDDANVPEGPIVITVDLDARVISVFRGGFEIGAAAVLLGTQEKPTPLGVFPIMQKRRHHVSNIYGAEMPYMQRLTNDGVALHASQVEKGYASRGCVGMPEPFAAKVFATTKVGDRVFITRGKMVKTGDSLVES